MKTEHYLLLGGGILAATLIKLPNGKSLLENLGAQLGAGVGGAIPAAVFSAGGAFVDTSYKAGFDAGDKFGDVLKPAAQKKAETQRIPLPSNFNTLPSAQQATTWDANYRAVVDPFAKVPILGNLSALWHNTLSGDSW